MSDDTGGRPDGERDTDSRQTNLVRAGKYLGIGVGVLVGLLVVLFALGVIGIPDAELTDNRWGEVDNRTVGVVTEVVIDNPNPFGFGGEADVTYTVDLEGVRLAEGEGTGVEVGSGTTRNNFTTTLFADRLPSWWSSHLNSDEVSQLEADATADVTFGPLSGSPGTTVEDEITTDIEGALDETTSEFEGEYRFAETGIQAPGDTSVAPSVEIQRASTEWGSVTEATTEIVTDITVRNDNPYPIPTPGFAGEVAMNGESLVAWSAGEVRVFDAERTELVGEEAFIPAGETEERTLLVTMDNENVAVWFPTHVDGERPAGDPGVEFTEMVVTAQLAFEVNGERLTIPPGDGAVACEFDMTTAIFVEQTAGLNPRGCGTTLLEQPSEQLDAAGATLDLTETEWWRGLGEDGPLPR